MKPELSTKGPLAHFVGFHDINPWDITEKFIGLHQAENDTVKYRSDSDFIKVAIWDLEQNDIRIIDEINTWNWQQGARVQWLPNSSSLIYNSRRNGSLISKIFCSTCIGTCGSV